MALREIHLREDEIGGLLSVCTAISDERTVMSDTTSPAELLSIAFGRFRHISVGETALTLAR